MKNKIKTKSEFMKLMNKPLRIIIDKNMKPPRPVGAIARKIEEANEAFSKVKNIKDILPPCDPFK